VRRSWRRASRLSHAQGAGGHFSGTEISPKNRSGALTCRRSQKLRIDMIDAARKIETIREKCRPSRAEDIIIIIIIIAR
jgi:hypothetical protein